MLRGVDRAVLPAGVIVHQAKAPAHHGVADLTDRQRTGHRARPAQPHEEVGSGELVDVGAAVHPVDAVPQRQRLGVAQHLPDGAAHLDPFAQGAAVALHRGRRGRGASHRAHGQQMPRPLAGVGVGRVFGVDGEFVARTAGGDPLPAGGVLDQGDDGTAAGRVDAQSVKVVGDRHTLDGLPLTGLRTRCEPVGPPPQRSDAVGAPTHRVAVVGDYRCHLGAVGVEHLHSRTHRGVEVYGDDVGSVVRQRVPHHH